MGCPGWGRARDGGEWAGPCPHALGVRRPRLPPGGSALSCSGRGWGPGARPAPALPSNRLPQSRGANSSIPCPAPAAGGDGAARLEAFSWKGFRLPPPWEGTVRCEREREPAQVHLDMRPPRRDPPFLLPRVSAAASRGASREAPREALCRRPAAPADLGTRPWETACGGWPEGPQRGRVAGTQPRTLERVWLVLT